MHVRSAAPIDDSVPKQLARRFRVMIVDDDRLAIDDLKRLVCWSDLGCSVVADARNGREALAKAREVHPDFVIADIRMPVMDGLQLAEELLQLNPCTRVLLLTAYRDFSYAREAVRLGVCSFVLKNEMDEQKLVAELRAMQRSWVRVALEHGAARREQLKWYALAVSKGSDPGDPPDIVTGCASLIAIFFAVDVSLSTILPPLSEVQVPADHIIASRTPLLDVIDQFEVAHLHSNVYVAVARIERVFCEDELQTHAHSLIRSIRKTVSEVSGHKTGALFTVCGCRGTRSLVPALERLFDFASFRYSLSPGASHSVDIVEREVVDDKTVQLMDDQEAQLIAAFMDQKESEIVQADESFAAMLSSGFLSEQTLVRVLEYYIHVAEQALLRSDSHILSINVRSTFRTLLESVHYASELRGVFHELFRRCVQSTERVFRHAYSMRVRKAIRFIEEHYHESIGVPDMASLVGLSVPRFSALFRRETDLSPAAYLAEYRVRKACKLLVESSLRVGDIAAATGYSSAQYFSRVLREHTGKTPVEYREEHALQ